MKRGGGRNSRKGLAEFSASLINKVLLAWFIPRLAACEAATPRVLFEVEVDAEVEALGTVMGDEDGVEVAAAEATPGRPNAAPSPYCIW